MKKKVFKNFLLSGSMISVVPISIIAVSCGTNKKNETKTDTPEAKPNTKDTSTVKTDTKADLTNVLNGINATIPNTSNKKIGDIANSDVVFSTYDTNKYTINIKSLEKDVAKNTIKVTYELQTKDKNLTSDPKDVTITLSGSTNVDEEENTDVVNVDEPIAQPSVLNDVLNKVSLNYTSDGSTLAKDLDLDEITANNLDTDKYDIELSNPKVSDDKESVTVDAVLSDINDPDSHSDVKKFTIRGFAKPADVTDLNTIANGVTFDYAKKDKVFAYDVDASKIISSKITDTGKAVDIKGYEIGEDGSSITVNYTVVEQKTGRESDLHSKAISGFKASDIKPSGLSRIFLSAKTNLLEIVKNKKQTLLNAIKDPKASFVFDLAKNRLVVSKNGATVDLSTPSTYDQIATIPKTLLGKKKSVVEKFVKGRINKILFSLLRKFLESKKGQDIKNSDIVKRLPSLVEKFAKGKIILDANWLNNITELFARTNKKFIFDIKSGQFLMPASETVDIDLNNKATYKVIISFSTDAIKKLINKVKEVLVSHKVPQKAIDAVFGNDINVFLSYQKTRNTVYNSIVFTRKSTA